MEIKFRGKRIDNGEWVYGYYVEGVNPQLTRNFHIIWDLYNEKHEVHPDSVGMWTGLKDKKGVDIFEKDIIRLLNKDGKDYAAFLQSIYYSESHARYCTKIYYPDGSIHDGLTLNFWWDIGDGKREYSLRVEVIGNTTDNPELLKDK